MIIIPVGIDKIKKELRQRFNASLRHPILTGTTGVP
jgi:hypothetical protein